MDYNEIRKNGGRSSRKRKSNKWQIVFLVVAIVAAAVVAFLIINSSNVADNPKTITKTTQIPIVTPVPTAVPTPVATATPLPRRGSAQPIPQDIREYMTGLSYKQNNNISLDDLSYLTIPHYDFNYNITEGHLVVNKALAEEVLDIFAELFDIKYPIERMELVDKYGADDFESIEYNNTSAFNYRQSTSGGGLSRHALGRAIDINPQINPYVNSNGTGAHSNAREYWSRDKSKWTKEIARAAYIGKDSQIYKIFMKYGWEWGGSWSSYRDYQHFEKD